MDEKDQASPEDDDIARLLRAAGPREQLPTDMQQRWEQQFRSELEPVLARRGRSRRNWLVGLCASLVAVAGVIALLRVPTASIAPQILISHVSGSSTLSQGETASAVSAGQQLLPGSTLETGTDGVVAVKYGDYDLRLNHNTRLLFTQDQLQLESGELYASDHGAARPARSLEIRTAHGLIRDIGTQFTVVASADMTVATVRRGAIVVDTGREQLRAEPVSGSASRLTVDQELQVREEQVPPNGADWNWIYLSGTHFSLEGRTVYDFLEWSVGESGRELEFASAGAETLARTTRLHGEIKDLNPEQALQPVLASTDLSAEPAADNILLIRLNRIH